MSFTLTSSGAIIMKAGENADATATASGSLIKEFADQAEGVICSQTRTDWVADYSTLNANFKKILDSAASAWAARLLINYNLSSFLSRAEALSMQNVLWTEYQEDIIALKDAEVRRAIGII